jgi:hypothetical protein
LEQYPWSSYRVYIGQQKKSPFVNTRWLELIGGKTLAARQERYRTYIHGMISKNDDELREILSASRYVVGDEAFIKKFENELRSKRHGDIREKDVAWPDDTFIGLTSIDEAVSEVYKLKKELLKCHGNTAGEAKGMALELACTLGGMTQRKAGQYYGGITCAAVGRQRQQIRVKIAKDSSLQRKFEQITSRLNL